MTMPLSSDSLRQYVRQVITERRHSSILEAPRTLEEGVYDPNILKAVFTAGGPGSGKSFTADAIFGARNSKGKPYFDNASFLGGGLKYVNSDRFFERELERAGIDPSDLARIEQEDPELWDKIQSVSDPSSVRNIAKGHLSILRRFLESGRLGLLVDGTGRDYEKMVREKQHAEDMGYDTYMIFVDTSLPVALERNANRNRVLPEKAVRDLWQQVQDNKARYEELFGANFVSVDNTEYGPPPQQVVKSLNRFMAEPIRNAAGQAWIQAELEKKAR